MEDELLGRQSAIAEARALYRMIGHGRNTFESLCELIAVPPKIERVLLAFARAHPEEAHSIDRNLKFRVSVARDPALIHDGPAHLYSGPGRHVKAGRASHVRLTLLVRISPAIR